MLLFRSEEHVDRWCRDRGEPKGAVLSLDQLWRLARVWHGDRLNPDWRRPTSGESQEIFNSLGLTGAFWQVT
jgi:hypothetical protein